VWFGAESERHTRALENLKSVTVFEVKENGVKESTNASRFIDHELALIYEDGERWLLGARRRRKRTAIRMRIAPVATSVQTRNTEKNPQPVSVHV